MTWFAFRMSGFGGRYVAERIVSVGPCGVYWTGTPKWSPARTLDDGRPFATEAECRAWCDQQNANLGG